MPWSEFCALLSGITHKSPLGIIVGIRAEEDKDTLKHFNKEQHRIRNEWRRNHALKMPKKDLDKAMEHLEKLFKQQFGTP